MPRMLDQNPLNARSQRLLKLLVDQYIREGQPVGSRTLSREPGLDLSAATIRNIMADLEDLGLIRAPHTSAGRIPTVRGYRLFIDSLLQIKPLQANEIKKLGEHLRQAERHNLSLLSQTSDLLSHLTHMVGIVMLPKLESQSLRHIEFLPLSARRVLVITVTHPHEVQNRIIHTSREYCASELQQAANYLSATFVGRDIRTVRQQLEEEMRVVNHNMNDLLRQILCDITAQSFDHDTPGDFVMSGQHHLMDVAELSDMDKLRALFGVFHQKRDMLKLLDQALGAEGVQIFIGEESGFQSLGECSIVTAPYCVDGKIIGVLGVIGPTRMPYARVIPLVDSTAKLLGNVLHQET
jgi:heat-inducible transcriptional repressor